MTSADDEQDHQPVPGAWWEEFDNIKPIRPIVYRKLAQGGLDAVGDAAREVKDEAAGHESGAQTRRH